ncbi:FliM/FliN family flagellar motor switch protein [Variovorax paradoxus]|uniref:Flagellar motor switch protein FliN-like C-terminal domain-containing protein n=1 Tax=Variovorax paradoxus TaxID=34073 RepID=A0A6I6HH87_VARPD|nr:FliM/FliN family flagellar motor switch protein [Variovorax paradoxus]QGW82255.1 hypothetical protein GOQ09_11985 [Variovorax paradoxus]
MNARPSNAVSIPVLLGVAESMRKARPLRNWQDQHKDAVRVRFSELFRSWHAEWIPARETSPAEADIQVQEPDGSVPLAPGDIACWSFAAPAHRTRRRSPDAPSSSRDGHDTAQAAIRAIADRMFAFDADTSTASSQEPQTVALAVARAAWEDWLQRFHALFPGLGIEAKEPAGSERASTPSNPWSGALCVRWPWCGGSWHLDLPHGAVAVLLGHAAGSASPPRTYPPQMPRVPLAQALSGQRVALRVMLEGTELNLGQLQGLQLGDVLPLAHALDAPAQVAGTDGAPVCHGWLGQSEGRIAVELGAPTSSTAVAAPLSNTHPSKERNL